MAKNDELLSSFEKSEEINIKIPKRLTILPLRDIIIFPNMIFPVLIGRTSTLKAVAEAMERDRFIFVSAQKNPLIDEPEYDDIYTYGITARIIQVLRLPNNLLKVLVEGLFQSKIKKKFKNKEYLEADVEEVKIEYTKKNKELNASIRHCGKLFADYIKSDRNSPPDMIAAYDSLEDPLQKLYYAASNIKTKVEQKQLLLEENDIKKQFMHLSSILQTELEMLKLEDEIEVKVHDSIQKTQRKYYIQEQIRTLQKELGEEEELMPELTALKELLESHTLPKHVKEKVDEEFERLKQTPTMSPEYSVNRNYLELVAALPWNKRTDDIFDIEHVLGILNEDHYDLEKPKERILEFIAILNIAGSLKKQILCFVGPPGVGKTSLAKSIARALGRNFVRFSLGGVRDEAEIRGHRRTYIGAMPGKIIQSMKKANTVNPVILLDEIDKMAMDFRGDPSAALLEVLDPEQNINFNDHYLEVDYDLSNVLFITTANVKYDIPLPLLDRMEVIELNSYLENDKVEIAKRHIMPKLLSEFGMDKMKIDFKDESILKIIRQYTRESGVRSLEREISSVLRKLAKDIVLDYDKTSKEKNNENTSFRTVSLKEDKAFNAAIKKRKIVIDSGAVEGYLKAPRFKDKHDELTDKVGVATGLAWTSVGGELLPVEVNIMPGTEKLTLTGKLGDVMKESASAAFSYIRANHEILGLAKEFNEKKEIHIHVPEGAIPKDGPSAGITMALAMISAFTGKALKGDLAMTGEITLRGNILPIGGLKEKLLAAKRIGIKTVFIPKDNERDIEDIDKAVTEGMEIIPVKHISEAIPLAFAESNN